MIAHIFKLIWNKKKSNALMILEILLAFLILFGVLTFITYNLNRFQKPLGFSAEDVLLIRLPYQNDLDSAQIAERNLNLKRQLKAIPVIEHVGFTSSATPFTENSSKSTSDDYGFEIERYIVELDEGIDETLDITLLEGRWFEEGDDQSNYTPIILNKYFLDTYFPGKNMLDSMISLGSEFKLIGVVEDYRYFGKFTEPKPTSIVYIPSTSSYYGTLAVKLKKGTPPTFEEELDKLITDITKDPGFLIENASSLQRRNERPHWVKITALLSMSIFLIINVALGLFGILLYNISRRRSEIGLRKALGAHNGLISRQFILEIFTITFIALIVGLFFAVQFPIFNVLDISAIDYTYALLGSTIIIILLVLLCTWYPSRQASLIHPSTALHED